MNPARPKALFCLPLILVWVCWVLAEAGPVTAAQDSSAKAAYLNADRCLQKLKKSTINQQKVSAWLNCIEKYESIYRTHPKDSWAPAGMYKAAELNFQLYQRSNRSMYKDRAQDLIDRIPTNYPRSAYKGRAKITAASIKKASKSSRTSIKTLKAKKDETKDVAAIARYNRTQEELKEISLQQAMGIHPPDPGLPIPEEQDEPILPPLPQGDARVTKLRFWSNPEYTRIVVNADGDRPYSHRLLKKDPELNVPFQRLYVDIEKARLGKGVSEHTPINDNLLKQARAGQYQPHTVRVVVDIKAFENYKIFSLKDPFRIVIDVWGENGKAAPMDEMQSAIDTPPLTPPEKRDQVTTDNLQSSDIARQLALGVRKIVIDPGHGEKIQAHPGIEKASGKRMSYLISPKTWRTN